MNAPRVKRVNRVQTKGLRSPIIGDFLRHQAQKIYKFGVRERWPGIYYVEGDIFAVHIIESKRLEGGGGIEKPQERSIEKTTTLILMYSIIAVMILNMTYAGRLTPSLPCLLLLGEEEWKLLYCGANKVKKEPKKPYSINEAVDYLGRLGGPKRSPSDGPPGVKTIWLELMKLYILLAYREHLA